jgi:hypothetical protein
MGFPLNCPGEAVTAQGPPDPFLAAPVRDFVVGRPPREKASAQSSTPQARHHSPIRARYGA